MKFTQPIKLVMTGNEAACHHHIRFAAKQLGLLERQMSFQGINEGKRTVSPYYGVVVGCVSRPNYKEINIYVQPEKVTVSKDYDEKGEQDKQEELLPECSQYLFYVRIECEGGGGAPPTDRLILYRMFFNGLPEDTPLTDAYNAANGFTPGEGKVIADVDLLESVLIYPIGLEEEEAASLVSLAATLSGNIPSISAEDVGVKNHFSDWYGGDPIENRQMENLIQAATVGGYGGDMPADPLPSVYLYEGLDVSGGVTWWFFTDQVDRYDGDRNIWRAIWSPAYGGDTRIHLDAYPWEDLEEVAPYYGTFAIPGNSGDSQILEEYTVPYNGGDKGPFDYYEDPATYYLIRARNGQRSGEELISGYFFTPSFENGPPTFFLAKKGFTGETVRIMAGTGMRQLNDGSYEEMYFAHVYPYLRVETFQDTVSSIVTPLEEISFEEFVAVSSSSVTCGEVDGTYWGTFPSVYVPEYGSGGCYEETDPYYIVDITVMNKLYEHWGRPCGDLTPPQIGTHDPYYDSIQPIYAGLIWLNANPTTETMELADCFILDDPPQENRLCQTKFCSFVYIDETIVQGDSALLDWQGGASFDPDSYHRYCDYEWLEEDEFKKTYKETLGCIIYIFAPRELYREDEAGNATYWDIHSARVGEGVINPFRCLDLEEYLLTVFDEIVSNLDSSPTTEKLIYTPPVAHSMDYYGYEIRTGFVREG